jgi:hypothetical protein
MAAENCASVFSTAAAAPSRKSSSSSTRVKLVEPADRGEQADRRVDHHRTMNVQLVLGGVDRLDDGRVRPAETVAEYVDLGDLGLLGQVRNDLDYGGVQIVAVLHEIAGDTRGGGGHDDPRERWRGHREDVIAGAVEHRAQHRELRCVGIAAGAGDDDGEGRGPLLGRKPYPQPLIEPEDLRDGPSPRQRKIHFEHRHGFGKGRDILGRCAEHGGAQRRRIGKSRGRPGCRGKLEGSGFRETR